MSSRIFIGRRTIAASIDWRPPRVATTIDYAKVHPEPTGAPSAVFAVVVFDDADKLNYRVVDNIVVSDGWFTDEQLCAALGTTRDQVIELVRRGVCEGVVSRPSMTKRYLVRDWGAARAFVSVRRPKPKRGGGIERRRRP